MKFANTTCSQCGTATGPGNSGHSSCATHQTPDLSSLYSYEFETSLGLILRCYLAYEEAEDGGSDHPSTQESVDLIYAFAGLVDVSEVLSDEVVEMIEEEALADLQQSATDSHDDARIDAYIDSLEYA